ncbi:MAG: hypothetical protein EBZ07_06240 [Verrucomicrobia bacterium]|nr:hypothetical protein [Verrucomicrobiota bacterium]
MGGTTIQSREYDGTTTAGAVTVGTAGNLVSGENLTVTLNNVANFSSADVGSESLAVTYTLADGAGGKASNYQLAGQSINGSITKRTLTMTGTSIGSREYDGTKLAGTVTVGTVGNVVSGEALVITGSGSAFSSANAGTTENLTVNYTLADGVNGKASNYQLGSQTASGSITTRTLTMSGSTAANRTYDGTVTAGVTPGTLGNLASGETLGTTTAAGTFTDRHVGNGKSVTAVYTLADGANPAHLASNYNLGNQTLTANITAKDLTILTTTVNTKAYDGATTATLAGSTLQTAIAPGTGTAIDGKPYTGDTITLGTAGTFERSLPGTLIPVTAGIVLGGTEAGNYHPVQPTGLKGEITGSATLNRDGSALNVNTGSFLHVRNTTATRMQDGMQFKTTVGEVLIENSSFDGWMQRSTPNTKSAAVAVNSPVMRIKMEANDPTANPATNLDYMLLGDYQLHLRHDPDGIPNSGDEQGTSIFSFPGKVSDPSGIGSIAPSADLVVRDSASTEFKDLAWNTPEYSSLDATTKEAVASGNYATASGEYQPDGSAKMSDLDTPTAAGKWDVTVSDPALGGEGKVTDLRLKYNNNTKVLIEGPDGVRLLNVKFEGMDEVDVRTTDLNNRVLMSATLLNDPDVTKMVVKASQTLEAVLNSDATFKEVKSLSNADLLAGVVRDNSSPTGFSFVGGVGGAERTLTIDGPGAAAATPNINIAGQLAIAAHTVVFNNANIASDGVIGVRTRDGLVNRTYGSVVPGTTSFTGANGNYFLNRNNGNPISMTIGNSGDITGAFTGGKLTDIGSGGSGTVMSVGKVQ